MLIHERVDKWIQEQMDSGKSRDDLHNTHFILSDDSVAVITKSGKKGFNLNVYYPPFTVNFMTE